MPPTQIVAFRASLDDSLPPNMPADTTEALRSSIHEAFAVVHEGAGGSASLVQILRDATAQGLLVYALIATVLVGATAGVFAAAFSGRAAPSRSAG